MAVTAAAALSTEQRKYRANDVIYNELGLNMCKVSPMEHGERRPWTHSTD